MACSIHIIWIISIKEHCFFNFIIFFWPLFLFINFLHSFHLTYKLSPASLPKKFTKLFDTLFEPIHLSKKEFKLLTQHSLVIGLNRGENYLIENRSPIDEKVAILLEGRLDVTHNGVFLHHIYPNDFVDSPEFKLSQLSERRHSLARQSTRPLSANLETPGKTCSNCKQVFVQIESGTRTTDRPASATSGRSTKMSMNRSDSKTGKNTDKSGAHPSQKRKSCAVKPQQTEDRPHFRQTDDRSKRELSRDILYIDSPIKEKLGFASASKLAQVTITASENCKLLCWKRSLLVEETLANNLRLKTIFNNLIGRDIIQKLYCVNEEQRKKQQQIIGESQNGSQKGQTTPCPTGKLLAHNPLRGDNLLSKLRETNLLTAYPYVPHESLIYLNQYNRNLGLAGVLPVNQTNQMHPYPNYYHPFLHAQAILNPPLVLPNSASLANDQQQQFTNLEINS